MLKAAIFYFAALIFALLPRYNMTQAWFFGMACGVLISVTDSIVMKIIDRKFHSKRKKGFMDVLGVNDDNMNAEAKQRTWIYCGRYEEYVSYCEINNIDFTSIKCDTRYLGDVHNLLADKDPVVVLYGTWYLREDLAFTLETLIVKLSHFERHAGTVECKIMELPMLVPLDKTER